jgi:hypothetical protein
MGEKNNSQPPIRKPLKFVTYLYVSKTINDYDNIVLELYSSTSRL